MNNYFYKIVLFTVWVEFYLQATKQTKITCIVFIFFSRMKLVLQILLGKQKTQYFCLPIFLKFYLISSSKFQFNLLMAEAILLFYSGNTWSQVMVHPQRRTVHWILQVVGSLCVIVGIALEYYWRDINNKLHFHDTHSILGLVALILMLLSMTNGLGALFSVELRRKIKPVYMKLGHQFVGLCCFVIGMAALVLGFDKKIFRNNSTPEMRTTLQVFTVLVILTSSLGVIRTILSQLKTLFR